MLRGSFILVQAIFQPWIQPGELLDRWHKDRDLRASTALLSQV